MFYFSYNVLTLVKSIQKDYLPNVCPKNAKSIPRYHFWLSILISCISSFERFSIYSRIIRSFKVDGKPYWLRRKKNIFVENFLSMQSFWVSILSVTGWVENAVFVSSSVLPHDLYLLIMSYKWVLIKVTSVNRWKYPLMEMHQLANCYGALGRFLSVYNLDILQGLCWQNLMIFKGFSFLCSPMQLHIWIIETKARSKK